MAREESFDAGVLPDLRRVVLAEVVTAGLGGDRARDVMLALHELAANSVRHGGGAGWLWMRVIAGALHCQVSDAGPGGGGPGGGGRARAPGVTLGSWPVRAGHGLWLVTDIADQVSIVPGPAGSKVTVTFALPGPGGQARFPPSGRDWAQPQVTP